MNNFLLTSALVMVAGAAAAQDVAAPTVSLNGEIAIDVEETAAGDIGATPSFALGVDADGIGDVSMSFEVTNGAVTLDEWSIGTTVAGASVSLGDQGDIFVEGEDGGTLATPSMGTSIQVEAGAVAVAVGFDDMAADVTDLDNVQVAYTAGLSIADVTAAADYNIDTEDYVLGARATTEGMIDNVGLGATMTYASASEAFGYEVDATVGSITGYFNGTDNDLAQNLGANLTRTVGNMEFGTGVNYNIDSEDLTPTASISFNF